MDNVSEYPATFVEGFHDAESVKRMKYRTLGNTGLVVSQLGLGLSSLGSVFRTTDDKESWTVVEHAIKSGINLIDGAPWYGNGKAERVFGEAIRRRNIPRNTYYLATKVGRYKPEVDKMFDFSAERTFQSVNESLERIGLDYIDIIQIHDMEFAPSIDVIVNETLPALQKLKDMGKVRMIGITGYPMELFRTVIEKSTVKIDTILTYCHYCLNDISLLDYLEYFKSKCIGVINASPTGMGLLTNRGTPSWHPATDEIKKVCKEAASYCQERDVDIARIALHFTCSNPNIPSTLVSTASLKNITSNIEVSCGQLTSKEVTVMTEIREKYFVPSGNKTWEGIEVNQYKETLSENLPR